jgi:hypothetical protein
VVAANDRRHCAGVSGAGVRLFQRSLRRSGTGNGFYRLGHGLSTALRAGRRFNRYHDKIPFLDWVSDFRGKEDSTGFSPEIN